MALSSSSSSLSSLSSPSLSPPRLMFDPEIPLDDNDEQHLYENCFKIVRERYSKTLEKDKLKETDDEKNSEFKMTTQFIYGIYSPPYSALNCEQMEQLLTQQQNPSGHICESLAMFKNTTEQERKLFLEWINSKWEKELKNRRLKIIPCVENFVESACFFSDNYMKTHYNNSYMLKSTIDYTANKFMSGLLSRDVIEMRHCRRINTSKIVYTIDLPTIDITDVESKISFTDGVYSPPITKLPFVEDEFCRALSKEHEIDINICLSSIKRIMNIEKSHSLWLIPVNIDTSNNRKVVYIGGALDGAIFSRQQRCLYYLRKIIKKKFRKPLLSTAYTDKYVSNNYKYNYDKWTLTVNKTNGDITKPLNLLIRSKPHIQESTTESNSGLSETVLVPKVEYQPEFGFEKYNEEQLVDYWLDTHFRSPKCNLVIVSVQYNMDIMMIKPENADRKDLISDEKKQICLQRLYAMLENCTQLNKGDYIVFHNPKNLCQVDLHQKNMYGYKLWNMITVLRDSEVTESLTWKPIDTEVLCPIHEYFKIAPGMFMPNFTKLKIKAINRKVEKCKKKLELKERINRVIKTKRKLKKNAKKKAKRALNKQTNRLQGTTSTKMI